MQKPNFHQLLLFCTVVEAGGFARAAAKLSISQPAVSVQVRQLEEFYGTPLIDRSARGLRLTEAGLVVYRYGQRIFNLTQEMATAIEDLKGLLAGRLVVAASTTPGEYQLPQALGEFKRRYPGVGLEIQIANSQHVVERILGHEVDVGLIGEEVQSPELVVEPYVMDDIVLIVPPGHLFLGGGPVAPARLAQEDFILREPGSATRHMAERALAELGVAMRVYMELGSNEAVKRAVAAGLGVGLLSRYAVETDLTAGRLATVEVQGLQCRRWLYIVYRRSKHLTRADQAFLALLREQQQAGGGGVDRSAGV